MSARSEAFNSGVHPITQADIKTIQYDARFPNCNQTKNCWQNFVDFHKCVKLKGEGYPPCKQFLKTYLSICPNAWVEKWNEQLDAGTFVYKENLSE
jgi:cytochrome c oxidase subunit 6b